MPTLLDAIKVKCNKVTLTIQGHCSSQEKKQPQLSKARAEAVKNWLIRNGVLQIELLVSLLLEVK